MSVFSPQAVSAAETAKAKAIWWSFKRGIGGFLCYAFVMSWIADCTSNMPTIKDKAVLIFVVNQPFKFDKF
ncbi:hypothetical protein ACTHSI_20110 [Neisseria sp. P0001.S004]